VRDGSRIRRDADPLSGFIHPSIKEAFAARVRLAVLDSLRAKNSARNRNIAEDMYVQRFGHDLLFVGRRRHPHVCQEFRLRLDAPVVINHNNAIVKQAVERRDIARFVCLIPKLFEGCDFGLNRGVGVSWAGSGKLATNIKSIRPVSFNCSISSRHYHRATKRAEVTLVTRFAV